MSGVSLEINLGGYLSRQVLEQWLRENRFDGPTEASKAIGEGLAYVSHDCKVVLGVKHVEGESYISLNIAPLSALREFTDDEVVMTRLSQTACQVLALFKIDFTHRFANRDRDLIYNSVLRSNAKITAKIEAESDADRLKLRLADLDSQEIYQFGLEDSDRIKREGRDSDLG